MTNLEDKKIDIINLDLVLEKEQGKENGYIAKLEHQTQENPKPVKFNFALTDKISGDKDFRHYFDDRFAGDLTQKKEELEIVGNALYKLIFKEDLGSRFKAWFNALKQNERFRLRLKIKAPELISVPWELMRDEKGFLARRSNVFIIRYMNVNKQEENIVHKIRLLIVTASPKNMSFNENEHIDELQKLFKLYEIHLDILSGEQVTREGLFNKLKDNKYNLFHFVGHGTFDKNEGKVWVIKQPGGKEESITAEDLGNWLSYSEVNFAFFCSCKTGITSQKNTFSGVAHSLISKNIPAVVAMQYDFPQGQATAFVKTFYDILLKGKPIDEAMSLARNRLPDNDIAWCIPVLYSQCDIFRLVTQFQQKEEAFTLQQKELKNKLEAEGLNKWVDTLRNQIQSQSVIATVGANSERLSLVSQGLQLELEKSDWLIVKHDLGNRPFTELALEFTKIKQCKKQIKEQEIREEKWNAVVSSILHDSKKKRLLIVVEASKEGLKLSPENKQFLEKLLNEADKVKELSLLFMQSVSYDNEVLNMFQKYDVKRFENLSPEFQQFLKDLDLDKYYPENLGREEVYSITEYSLEQNSPRIKKQLATHFLSNLISFNYEARKLKITSGNNLTSETEQTLEEDDWLTSSNSQEQETSDVHPLDVVAATLLCCHPIIRQDLFQRLWGCKLAIPLVIQEGEDKSPKFFLWAMRSLVMGWKLKEEERQERSISNYPVETVSFIRFSKSEADFSKSSLLNWVISENEPDKSHPIFFHRNSEGSTNNRRLAEGMVEVAWYLPKGVENDNFEDIVLFANLRGDARKHPIQLNLIKQISSKIVILASAKDLSSEQEVKIVQDFLKSGKAVIICLTDKAKNDEVSLIVKNFIQKFDQDYNYQKTLQIPSSILGKNHPEIRDKIRKILKEIQVSDKSKVNLEDIAKEVQALGIDVDELEENCQEGIKKAKEILQIIQKHHKDKRKAELLPLQGQYWDDWAEADKEIAWPKKHNSNQESLSDYLAKKTRCKRESRKQQLSIVENDLPTVMQLFIKGLSEELSVREYFVRYLKLGLDELSREEITRTREEITRLCSSYSEQTTKSNKAETPEHKVTINEALENLDKKIASQSFGLEHLLREMGQIYSAVIESSDSQKKEDFKQLPHIAADLLLSGYPLEIMDGDVSAVPFDWVEAVLKELNQILKEREKRDNLRVFVLSAMGIQSSGKSTLLNTMFGLQFAVSAGRCTKGVYLQPVKLEQKLRKKYNVDYIFVVDTEGLKSPELSSERTHDNALSTFVIGLSNLTLIKLPGENNTYLQEILPISVQAFLKMEEVKLYPKTKIVHRNVTISETEKLQSQNRILNSELDKATEIACNNENKEIKQFKELIDFNLAEDVEYLPSLYEGDDSRNAVIRNYSKEVNKLKRKILTGIKINTELSIIDFYKHLQHLWEAVKKRNFVFAYKNTIEIQARRQLDKYWNDIEWEFNHQVRQYIYKASNRITDCRDEIELSTISGRLKGIFSKKIKNIKKQKRKNLELYFKRLKEKYGEAIEEMEKWEQNIFTKLDTLSDSLTINSHNDITSRQKSKQAELTIDKKMLNYENQMIDSIRLFVEQEKKKRSEEGIRSLSQSHEEQRKLFDQEWENWMKDVKEDYEPRKPGDIKKDIQNAVKDNYPDHWRQIIDKIFKKPS
jgi:hypothetical protein